MWAEPDGVIPAATTYEWDFGIDAVPPTATGPGPHIVQYTTPSPVDGFKEVTCTTSLYGIEHTETAFFTIAACFGNISGTLFDNNNLPLQGQNVRLYADFNNDDIADGLAVRSVFTTSTGTWAMANLNPGSYILELPNSTTNAVTFTDTNIISPVFDQILDPLTPVAGVSNPLNKAVRIPVRVSKINGSIAIIKEI